MASQKSHPSAALAARLTISPINKHHAISRQVATSGWRRLLRGLWSVVTVVLTVPPLAGSRRRLHLPLHRGTVLLSLLANRKRRQFSCRRGRFLAYRLDRLCECEAATSECHRLAALLDQAANSHPFGAVLVVHPVPGAQLVDMHPGPAARPTAGRHERLDRLRPEPPVTVFHGGVARNEVKYRTPNEDEEINRVARFSGLGLLARAL